MLKKYKWRKYLSYQALIGIREYSRVRERLTTIKEFKKDFNNESILDVGCGKNFSELKNHFGKNYFAVDFIGDYVKEKINDKNFTVYNLNLNKLPYDDNTFDNVLCTDVLEHLESPHDMIRELFRVSKKKVIISLPNNWPTFFLDIITGFGKKKLGYGLPIEKPAPGRRHTFFFNLEEACDFLEGNMNEEFKINHVRFIFERPYDGILSSILTRFNFRVNIYNILGKLELHHVKKYFNDKYFSYLIFFNLKIIKNIFYFLNIIITLIFYNLPIIRFYNNFCRQVWFVYKKN